MDLVQKRKVFNAHILSILKYGICQYIGEKVSTQQRLHSAIMTSIRYIRGYIPNRRSNEDYLTDLNCESPSQIVMKEAAKYCHKIIFTGKPERLHREIRFPTHARRQNITL